MPTKDPTDRKLPVTRSPQIVHQRQQRMALVTMPLLDRQLLRE